MHKLKWVILWGLFPFLLAAKKLPDVQLTGLPDKLNNTTQHYLNQWSGSQALLTRSDTAIKEQITQVLAPNGYFKPTIALDRSTPKRLLIRVEAGPQSRITSLDLKIEGEGATHLIFQAAAENFPLHTGEPFNNSRYNEAKQSLLTAAEQAGYLHATFENAVVAVDKTSNTLRIVLRFNTGFPYYFGTLRVSKTHLSSHFLQRFAPFKPGDPYSTEKSLAFQNQLASSGYFNHVLVQPAEPSAQHIPLEITLQDVKRVQYALGAGYGTDTGPRGRLDLHVIPINRYGHMFNLFALGSLTQNTLQAQYIVPGHNPVTDQYAFSGNVSNFNYDAGYSNAILLSQALRHDTGWFQRIFSLNELYERFHYEQSSNTETKMVYPKLTLSWNNTHKALFQKTGYHLTLNGLAANRAILSDVSMTQISADLRTALTLDPLRTRVYLHLLEAKTSLKDINTLPLSLALLLGGTDTLKGYGFNSIGPGKILQYGGIEIQKELRDAWYFTGFFDTGAVYNPDIKQFNHDAGFGLMWISPIGPIKIGLAQAIDSGFQRIPDKKPRLVISMGPDL